MGYPARMYPITMTWCSPEIDWITVFKVSSIVFKPLILLLSMADGDLSPVLSVTVFMDSYVNNITMKLLEKYILDDNNIRNCSYNYLKNTTEGRSTPPLPLQRMPLHRSSTVSGRKVAVYCRCESDSRRTKQTISIIDSADWATARTQPTAGYWQELNYL